MNDKSQQLDHTMMALAHPVRRAILDRLMRRGEARVTALAEPFDMSLNAVSKHIQILERANLVTRRREWREHVVSFNPDPLASVTQWLEKRAPKPKPKTKPKTKRKPRVKVEVQAQPQPAPEPKPELKPEPTPTPEPAVTRTFDALDAFLKAERGG